MAAPGRWKSWASASGALSLGPLVRSLELLAARIHTISRARLQLVVPYCQRLQRRTSALRDLFGRVQRLAHELLVGRTLAERQHHDLVSVYYLATGGVVDQEGVLPRPLGQVRSGLFSLLHKALLEEVDPARHPGV